MTPILHQQQPPTQRNFLHPALSSLLNFGDYTASIIRSSRSIPELQDTFNPGNSNFTRLFVVFFFFDFLSIIETSEIKRWLAFLQNQSIVKSSSYRLLQDGHRISIYSCFFLLAEGRKSLTIRDSIGHYSDVRILL